MITFKRKQGRVNAEEPALSFFFYLNTIAIDLNPLCGNSAANRKGVIA
jgi:hypothetical protein